MAGPACRRRWSCALRGIRPVSTAPSRRLTGLGGAGSSLAATLDWSLVKDLFNALDTWHGSGRDAAIARVVDLDGSGPRLPGAAMAVNLDQDVRGSVSGGCVEG
ncbi:MAG: XdhC family protein, partial [Actinomycetota bacterium]|nr:XdhC family protein [Actinomycetota bacterium]